jgi:hypothetical protein
MKRDAPADQVFPTLAFAGYVIGQNIPGAIARRNRLIKASGKPAAWETEVARFVSRFPGARPVDVKGETVILEQEPCSIEIVRYPQTDIPELVEIHLYRRRRYTRREDIAKRYIEKLTDAGIACDFGDWLLPMRAEPFGARLIVTVTNHKPDVPVDRASVVWRDEQPRFPHPEAVSGYCEFAIGEKEGNGFARGLGMRDRDSDRVTAATLAPPCVALCLREVWGMKGRQGTHRLLNDHVYVGQFAGSKIPLDRSDRSKENTLWEQIDKPKLYYKVRQPLVAATNALLSPR